MTTFNAKTARQITEEARKIKRENEVLMMTDAVVSSIQSAAENGDDHTLISLYDDIILDVMNNIQNMGFKVSAVDMDKIEVSW